MSDKGQQADLKESANHRSKEEVSRQGRELESDDVLENQALGRVTSPNGDDTGENRVTTSLSED